MPNVGGNKRLIKHKQIIMNMGHIQALPGHGNYLLSQKMDKVNHKYK